MERRIVDPCPGARGDSYHDRRTAFLFMVNPAGVKRDVYLFDDTNEDDSWDADPLYNETGPETGNLTST